MSECRSYGNVSEAAESKCGNQLHVTWAIRPTYVVLHISNIATADAQQCDRFGGVTHKVAPEDDEEECNQPG